MAKKIVKNEGPKRFRTCQAVRRRLVPKGQFDPALGVFNETGTSSWETDRCGTALFSDESKLRGTCHSCHSGWNHADNREATPTECAAAGLEQHVPPEVSS